MPFNIAMTKTPNIMTKLSCRSSKMLSESVLVEVWIDKLTPQTPNPTWMNFAPFSHMDKKHVKLNQIKRPGYVKGGYRYCQLQQCV